MFLCLTEAFLRPDLDWGGAPRAAAVKAGRRCTGAAGSGSPGHALTAASTARSFEGRGDGRRADWADMTLDSAVSGDCGKIRITLYPVGRDGPDPNSSCTGEGKADRRRDPSEKAGWLGPWMRTVTRLSFVMSAIIGRGRSQAGVQHGAGGHHAGLEISPQRHHQLARHRHDGDASYATLDVAHPLAEPKGQIVVGLMSDPQPGEFDGEFAGAVVASFADALVALAVPAIVRHPDQPEVAAYLAAIVEGAIEHFIDQPLPADRTNALELSEVHGLGFRRARRRGALLGPAVGFQDGQLLVHQAQPFVLARNLLLEALRQRPPVAGAQAGELVEKARLERHGVTDTLRVQQALDAIGVGGAFLEHALALPVAPFAVLVFDRRYVHHAAHSRLSPQKSQQRAHQLFQIDAVGLGPPRTAAHLDAGGVDLVIDNALVRQPAMQPVPIKAGLVARHDPHRLAGPCCLRARGCKPCRQRRQVAPRNRVAAHLRRAGHHHAELPLRLTQFKCNVHRGIVVRGGCVSVIELQHLDLRGWDESLQTNPTSLTSHHPIVSEEAALFGWPSRRMDARQDSRPSFETAARRARPP